MTITQITDHEDRAAARIAGKLRDKPRFEALVRALVSPFQEIEDALWALFESDVDRATGDELDVLGRVVGELRAGETDDDLYRRRVRARIMVNRSNGTVEDIIRVVRLILADDAVRVQIRPVYPAGFVAELEDAPVEDDSVADLIATFIRGRTRGAAAAGITTRVTHSYYDRDHTFRLGISAHAAAIAASASTINTEGLLPVGKFPQGGGYIEIRGEDSMGDEHTEVLHYSSFSYAPPPSNIGTFRLTYPSATRYDYAVRTNRVPAGGTVGATITLVEPTVERGFDDPVSISADGTFDLVVTAGATYPIAVPAGLWSPRQLGAIIAAQVSAETDLLAAVGYDDGLEIWYLLFYHSSTTVTVQNFSSATLLAELGYTTDPTGPASPLLPTNGVTTGNGGHLARLAEVA